MIPICAAPKRFAATLVASQPKKFIQRCLGNRLVTQMMPNAIVGRFHSTVTVPDSTNHLHNVAYATTVASKGIHLYNKRSMDWYTGKKPIYGECPGVCEDGKIYSLPHLNLHQCDRKKLQDYFDNTWTITEVLFASLQGEEAFMVPPLHGIRHPLIFYYGHVACVYINKLRVAGVLKDSINPYFESIFETGVDEMSWDDLSKNEMKWPSVAEVHDYRKKSYDIITNLIAAATDAEIANITIDSPFWALAMGFEHERIHIETSSVLINELPLKYVNFPEGFPSYHLPESTTKHDPVVGKDFPANEFIHVPATSVHLGKPRNFPSFGWDNEYGSRTYEVADFKASKFLISNGEYLEFVKEGGYANADFWTSEGWKWRAFRNTKWPTFWIREGPQGLHYYNIRLMFDEVPMTWSHPVCVNLHEAVAFTKWKSMKEGKKYRLLTEVEHHAIRDPIPMKYDNGVEYLNDPVLSYTYGPKHTNKTNLNMVHGSTTPVNLYPPNKLGFYDVMGNTWERCVDFFAALPGFRTHPYYEDFSTPCFDGRHHIITGGSFISTGDEASHFSRFHFRPHFHQFSSFRLVECIIDEYVTSDTNAGFPYVGNYPFNTTLSNVITSTPGSPISIQSASAATSAASNVVGYAIVPSYTKAKEYASILLEKGLVKHANILPAIATMSLQANAIDTKENQVILMLLGDSKNSIEISKVVPGIFPIA